MEYIEKPAIRNEKINLGKKFLNSFSNEDKKNQKFVKLDDIIIQEPWSMDKYTKNYNLILNSNNVKPIILEYDEKLKKYTIIDGIHRCIVALDLGYEFIN